MSDLSLINFINVSACAVIAALVALVFWLVRRDIIRAADTFSNNLATAMINTKERVDDIDDTVKKQGLKIERIDKEVEVIKANPVLHSNS